MRRCRRLRLTLYLFCQPYPTPMAQHGICGAASVEEYATGVIKRHEKTQIKKENDRTRLTYTQVGEAGSLS